MEECYMSYKKKSAYIIASISIVGNIGLLKGESIYAASIKDTKHTLIQKGDTSNLESPFKMPLEQQIHQGTWLQWPHNYTLENGAGYRESLEHIWIELTRHLVKGEEVHIVAYNLNERLHIEETLKKEKINMDKVYIHIYPTDDVWIRDNGPIFLYNSDNQLVLADWGFNGWGGKVPYEKDKQIPKQISQNLGIPRLDLKHKVLEPVYNLCKKGFLI
ncbi:hypothetical protein CN386_18320 [Bacillus cereus]|nr:hypothetical protein CN386_18320 [Bacillus cereus]